MYSFWLITRSVQIILFLFSRDDGDDDLHTTAFYATSVSLYFNNFHTIYIIFK